MKNDKKDDFTITELFTAKAGNDHSRYFVGTIIREKDENGKEVMVRGKINVKNEQHDGYILATAKDQWELGKKLDVLVLLILDYRLHNFKSFNIKIGDVDFCLN